MGFAWRSVQQTALYVVLRARESGVANPRWPESVATVVAALYARNA